MPMYKYMYITYLGVYENTCQSHLSKASSVDPNLANGVLTRNVICTMSKTTIHPSSFD